MKKKKSIFKSVSFKKSVLVGISVLVLDILWHTLFIDRPETFYYFFWKLIISGYIAFLMFESKNSISKFVNFFKFKAGSHYYYLYFAFLFSLVWTLLSHIGIAHSVIPLFTRVQDINLGISFFIQALLLWEHLGWLFIHGGSYYIGTLIIKGLKIKNG